MKKLARLMAVGFTTDFPIQLLQKGPRAGTVGCFLKLARGFLVLAMYSPQKKAAQELINPMRLSETRVLTCRVARNADVG
jgi:hypothetical protein